MNTAVNPLLLNTFYIINIGWTILIIVREFGRIVKEKRTPRTI